MTRMTLTGAAIVVATSITALSGQTAAKPSVLVPAGTTINVRLTDAIDVDATQAGTTFKAIVDDPVVIKGNTVIPRDARAVLQAVKVTQSGKAKGADAISLKLNSVAFGGKTHDVTTEYATVQGKGEGKKTARKVGGGAGLGAIVGGIAGGGTGAAIGAVVGTAGGAALAATGEEHLRLDAETRLQFKLSSDTRIEP